MDDPLLLEAEVANAPGGFIVIFIVEIIDNGTCRRPIHAVIMEPGEWEVLGCET